MATERTWRCLWPKCQCVWVPDTWPDDDDKYCCCCLCSYDVHVFLHLQHLITHTLCCKSEYGSHHIPGSL